MGKSDKEKRPPPRTKWDMVHRSKKDYDRRAEKEEIEQQLDGTGADSDTDGEDPKDQENPEDQKDQEDPKEGDG
jgi:hypothetical protein